MKHLFVLVFFLLSIHAEIPSVEELKEVIEAAGKEGLPTLPSGASQLQVTNFPKIVAAAALSNQRSKFAAVIRDTPLHIVSAYLNEANAQLIQLKEPQKKILADSVRAETFDLACKSEDFNTCFLALDYIDTQLSEYSIQKHCPLEKTMGCLYYLAKSVGSVSLPAALKDRTPEILEAANRYNHASAYLLATFPSLCVIENLTNEQPFWCTLAFEGRQRVRAYFGVPSVDVSSWVVRKAEAAIKAVQKPPTVAKPVEWHKKALQHTKFICENIKDWPETYQLAKIECDSL
ncbi:hypothetical protein PSACC_03624 [Paramicrosporidium saccamoebae]|uniref:Uncharacterized protein n=1 Tax=Paramicrosporidium saccamoebae TaxID=1246581 RepID=A0A2H9TFT3_9FUNG|nr:hypothetical protein PSACC_03624 [Paramicrosporidium saccamoebae]